jgi:hypothetical protein
MDPSNDVGQQCVADRASGRGGANVALRLPSLPLGLGYRSAAFTRLLVVTAVVLAAMLRFGWQNQLPGFLFGNAASQLVLAAVAFAHLIRAR